MKGLNEGRLFLVIIIAAFIIGGFDYLSSINACVPADITDNAAGNAAGPGEYRIVTRVIDGDTVVVEGGDHVRLLGMDADERGDPCYSAAKDRLEELVLNKEVYLEPDAEDMDIYDRYLRYIFLDGMNINQKLVEEGLAIARFYPENVKYREEITAAEKTAMLNKIGCKWSGQ